MTAAATIAAGLAQAAAAPAPGSYFGMPEQGSTIAPTVDLIYDIVTWISVFFFVLVTVVMVYFMFRYRRREHVASTGGPTHHTPLEVTWSVIPLILVIGIFYVGLKGYVHMGTPPQDAYRVDVTGQRWFWTFDYPNGASETNILHVPVGRPVMLTMRSDDVIHSLFIPAFRVKQDVVPGKRTQLWFEATRTGDFDLFCTEYCGTQHSQMVGMVKVYEPDEFRVVMEELRDWIKWVPDDKLHLAGALIYNQCASCHTLDGSRLIAPSFTETYELLEAGGTRTFEDGSTATVDEAYVRDSIMDPLSQIVETYPASMPSGIGERLGDRKVDALVQFIRKLDEVAPGGELIDVKREEIVEKPAEQVAEAR